MEEIRLDRTPSFTIHHEDGPLLYALDVRHRGLVVQAGAIGGEPLLAPWQQVRVQVRDSVWLGKAETGGSLAARLARRIEDHGELVLVVDDLTAASPVRWQWRLELPAKPVLATHARRCDLVGDGAGVRFYWLAPEGIRARLSESDPNCTLTLETTQPTREVRIAVAVLPWVGEPPLPQRYRDGDELGVRLDTPSGRVTASCAAYGDR